METSKILIAYFIYLPIALLLTFYVSKTLFKNSKVYMLDIFKGREEIANSTNKLFETGFYLLNIGFALMILRITEKLSTYQQLIEALSHKIGGFSVYLGIMLFLNLYFFFKGNRKTNEVKVKRQQPLRPEIS
jgi:predicted PurR-regulated permease PerM